MSQRQVVIHHHQRPLFQRPPLQHPRDLEVNKVLVDRGLEVLRAMGGENVRVTRRGQQTYWLQAGTCRFGKDPRRSVLDPDCRVHTAPNVFVTDSSFMPTSGGVPVTIETLFVFVNDGNAARAPPR